MSQSSGRFSYQTLMGIFLKAKRPNYETYIFAIGMRTGNRGTEQLHFVLFFVLQLHHEICPEYPVVCPNDNCNVVMKTSRVSQLF